MNNKQKFALTFTGVVAAVVLFVKSTEEPEDVYLKRELEAVKKELAEVEVKWNTAHMSLNDAANLQSRERRLLKRKFEVEAKLESMGK